MKIKAFTFVEILISITIIWITTSYWLYSFFNFYDSQELNNKIWYLDEYIKDKNKEVKNKKIYDYSIELRSWNNYLIYYSDIFEIDNYQKIEVNNSSGTINLTKQNPSDEINTKIFKNSKLFYNSGTNSHKIDLDIQKFNDYKIISYLSWSIYSYLNDIELVYLDKNSQIKDSEVFIEKITYSWWLNLDNIEIKNINNYISFYSSWSELNTENINIHLNNWKNSNYITIKK